MNVWVVFRVEENREPWRYPPNLQPIGLYRTQHDGAPLAFNQLVEGIELPDAKYVWLANGTLAYEDWEYTDSPADSAEQEILDRIEEEYDHPAVRTETLHRHGFGAALMRNGYAGNLVTGDDILLNVARFFESWNEQGWYGNGHGVVRSEQVGEGVFEIELGGYVGDEFANRTYRVSVQAEDV